MDLDMGAVAGRTAEMLGAQVGGLTAELVATRMRVEQLQQRIEELEAEVARAGGASDD